MTYVRAFGAGRVPDGDANKALLGGKGAGLATMSRLGLPVPPGFTITTEASGYFLHHEGQWPDGLAAEVREAVASLEEASGKRFGDTNEPLLVSVRSGAAVSMPGMMDTVLNLGLNRDTAEALAKAAGDARFAWDSYRRFIKMYGDIVLGIHYTRFARAEDAFCGERSAADLDASELQSLCVELEQVVEDAGRTFPADPHDQLHHAIDAVFSSYNSHRARYYRKTNGIPDDAGTAVNVQAMVFGNRGKTSGTGVAFTRNPKNGAPGVFGEWLTDAQGEDVVAGTRTPQTIAKDGSGTTLEEMMPEQHAELLRVAAELEDHFHDMQDIEFTIENGSLYLLQTRTGKRSASAAVRIAVDLKQAGVIDVSEALGRIQPEDLELVLRPVINPEAKRKVIAHGLDASPGAACGRVVFHSSDVQEFFERDEPTVLVRMDTSPEDIQGMTVAQGVLTSRGGQTSHAAVVARGMGKPCVVGCTEIHVDYGRQLFYAGDTVVRKGDWITIDGGTGDVMEGKVEMLAPDPEQGAMSTLLSWADEHARLAVRANADNGADASRARELGAVGIGLCRTEHMFFQPDALRAMRRMILAEDPHARQRALTDILPVQRSMFTEIFHAMDGLPVTIRLLDPPLHEFLPKSEDDIAAVAEDLGIRTDALRSRIEQLEEANPMLGHRGVRVGITAPEVYRMQVRAIFEAACEAQKAGAVVFPEVMIPLVAMPAELERTREEATDVAEAVLAEFDTTLDYTVGTMIEIPRAALMAEQVAKHADFFSFGTNDLTQLTYGFSRDDMNKFFPDYQRLGLLPDSPLAVFDVDGVGQLVKMGTEGGRKGNTRLKVGVCGEHGGDPTGVRFFHAVGLDYVSCSPYRVPVARLAAAHAALGIGG